MLLDMKLTRTYNPKTATSSNPNAVTANATSSAMNGTYEISVSQLATNEMRVSGKMSLAAKDAIGVSGTFRFHTFDENGNQETHEIEVAAEDTLESVLKKIEQASGGKVRAFYVNRSEERRVGKECSTQSAAYHSKKAATTACTARCS